MKITNDVNNNSDFLSVSNKEDNNASLLSSLFSTNFNNEEKSNDISQDFEFIFNEEDIAIIDNLSNYLPNLNIPNLDSPDFKKIKSDILSDESIKTEIKDKILILLESTKDFNKNFFIRLPEYQKFKSSNIKNIIDHKGNVKIINKSSKSLESLLKNKEQYINQNSEKSFKSNNVNKITNETTKSEHQLDNETRFDSKNRKLNFVKKIKKNDHPNKLYQVSKSNSFTFREKIDSISLIDASLSNNTNLKYSNNQISDELKKNMMNEIKVNDKLHNNQNSNDSGTKGNQFSQQNNASFTNSRVNSILEGLLDTLDLGQKGWTTKLVSRIENALENGGEEIDFNLKPKNLGKLKVSISLKNGTGSVKIITENTFVTNALNQNENHLQKLFNDQGINLEFAAYDESKNFGSKNNSNTNQNKNNQNNFQNSDDKQEQINNLTGLDDDVSSRHIVNVIA